MASNRVKVMVLPGDGIGPEVTAQGRRVLERVAGDAGLGVTVEEGLVGYAAYRKHGTPLSDETLADVLAADAVLFGAQGGPEHDAIPIEARRARGLLHLRKTMDLFANIRPIKVHDALLDASPLKPERIRSADLIVLREGAGGAYFGTPRGIERLAGGGERAVNTTVYTSAEVERIVRLAFELAAARRNRVCSVEKSNVMEVGQLWRRVAERVHAREFPGAELTSMYADNCAMQLVRDPRQFDVIVTDNLFGDLLSDCGAMVAGSLGMLPSASLGPLDRESGRRAALYEPVHGSAPDIAGRGSANPLASILSVAMLLRYSLHREAAAARVETAVDDVLAAGLRTPDIAVPGTTPVTTIEMGDAVVAALDDQAGSR